MSDAVKSIMQRAGMECHLPVATATTTNGICANMTQAAGNAAKYGDLAGKIVENSQNSGASIGAGPQAGGGGSSFMRSAITAGALAVGAIFAPALAPALAVGGALAATVDAGKFIGHAAVNGAQGEMTLASSLATFGKNGDITSYKPACEEYEAAPAKPKASVALGQQGSAPARGMQNIREIISDEMSGADIAEVQAFLKKKADDNIGVVNKSLYHLDKKGALAANDPNALALKENMDDVSTKIGNMTVAVARPAKALNVGMTGPG